MFREFVSQQLLAERSPHTRVYSGVEIALRLAVLGFIPQAVEIINIASKCGDLELRYLYTNGLYFAFEAANLWPIIVPEEHRTPKYLEKLDEDDSIKWGTLLGNYDDSVHEPLPPDESGLARLLKFVHGDGERFTYPFRDDQYILLHQYDARCVAADLALRLGTHEEEARRLISAQDMNDEEKTVHCKRIAKSRLVWRVLKDEGGFNSGENKNETLLEFERLRDIFRQNRDGGTQRPFKDKTMLELIQILDRNTVSHDLDEDADDAELSDLREHNPSLLGNRTIMHQPATDSDIAKIEEKFKFKIPEDYKEFLKITNGLEGIWNGYFHMRHLEGVDEISQGDDVLKGDSALPCELITWEELPFQVKWPSLDLERALNLNKDFDSGNTWLVEPKLIKEAVQNFFDAFDEANLDDKAKATVERTVSSYFGGIQEMKDMEWGILTWSHWGITITAWKSFRDFLETLAVESEKSPKAEA
ncbi:hypothetical protein G7Y89_g13 [Cudoniella acicularis]|uniref:Knr4/Smi1-like domain-containing protein n=1 Tax=Cudoniella acicularis TaxID=354080 RepID=A0A8H4RZN1_9HELO|nr:hypothetical protein G7Y89_g13 [Cudoniella acicularis]